MHDGLLISVEFWVSFSLFVILDRGLEGILASRVRYLLSCVASAGFLWYFTDIGTVNLAALYLGLTVVFFAATRAFLAKSARPVLARLVLILGIVTTVWALGKIGSSLGITHFAWLFFLGASFLLVKIWTFCKDLYDRRIPDPRWLTFLSYCTFFPCFISGPMHYYSEFSRSFEERTPLNGEALVNFTFRILHGLVKVLIVALALRPYSLEALGGSGFSEVSLVELVLRSVIYSLVIYLDFSGYSDIAISSGFLIGVAVPENFRLPYLARNLREFWQRWHITFTRFLTQYLFIPLVRAAQRRFSGITPFQTASVAYLLTFLFCGFWHGSTPGYLAWGLYHGVGLVGYDLYRKQRLAPKEPSLLNRGVHVAATFLFVSVGWVLFTLPLAFWVR